MNIPGRWSKSAFNMLFGMAGRYIHHYLLAQGSVIKSFCILHHKLISEV